jgi:hypothetical protein
MIALSISGVIIAFLNFFGNEITTRIIDLFQSKVCLSKICINKPKGWIITYIKKNNQLYVLGFINSRYLPFDINTSKYNNNELELTKGFNSDNSIKISELISINDKIISHMNSYHFNDKKYFYLKKGYGAIVINIDEKVIFMMDKLNKELINEILKK